MKLMVKTFCLSALFILTSCAHHQGCSTSGKQCEMHSCCKKDQCKMKSEGNSAEENKEAPAAK